MSFDLDELLHLQADVGLLNQASLDAPEDVELLQRAREASAAYLDALLEHGPDILLALVEEKNFAAALVDIILRAGGAPKVPALLQYGNGEVKMFPIFGLGGDTAE